MSVTQQQREDLAAVDSEVAALSGKVKFTKQDEVRFGFLKMAQVAIREEGMALEELEHGELRRKAQSVGVEVPDPKHISNEVRAFQHAVERRDVEGAPMSSHIGTYSGLGYFVPTGFFNRVFEAMKKADPIFNRGRDQATDSALSEVAAY